MTKLMRFSPRFDVRIDRDSMLHPFERYVDEFFKDAFPEWSKMFGVNPFGADAYPKVDVIEYDDKMEVIAEVAGYRKEDIHVDVEDNYLTIIGESSTRQQEDQGAKYWRRELKRSKFSRSFTIGEGLDSTAVKAKFENGILNITIPKIVKEQPSNKQTIKIE